MPNFIDATTKFNHIIQIKRHGNMEHVYKYIPKRLLPVEYLPDDYKGPNAGTIPEITGNIFSVIILECKICTCIMSVCM